MVNEEPSYMMFARAYVEDKMAAPHSLVKSLLERIDRLEAKQPDHSFRVVHERTGKVAYEGESYYEAAIAQTGANQMLSIDGEEPFWRMWLVDNDGDSCIVQTQQPTR